MNYRSKYTGKQIDEAVALAQTALQSTKTEYLTKKDYEALKLAGNLRDDVEYNVFEEEEE